MFISAKAEEFDRLVGFELGADDFIVKPFSVREVIARIRAVARRCYARQPDAPPAQRWRWLEAAHPLGQTSLPLHWRSQTAMLRYALALGDAREATGQLLRLALVPRGHLLARLPLGNIGRSHVSAFRPMVPAAGVSVLMDQALEETAIRPVQPDEHGV